MDDNPVVLSFHESLLRLSDVELLRGPYWLNDTIISFYFEFLEIIKLKKNPTLLFVPPQVTQCVKVSPNTETGVFLEPLNSQGRDFIFFALNDNEQTDICGGTHWSLLVFSCPEKMIFHFDSLRGSNQYQAVEFGEKLLKYFGLPSYGCYQEIPVLQQRNGYDCGIHVICNAENLANHAIRFKQIDGCPVLEPQYVVRKRREILELIHHLRSSQK